LVDKKLESGDKTYYFGISPPQTSGTNYSWLYRTLLISKRQVDDALKDPYSNYQILQDYSYRISGLSTFYNNYLEYLANLLTFDYFLYPTKENVDHVEYTRLAKDVSKYDVKSFPRVALYDTLKYGESYWIPVTSSQAGEGNKTMYQKIPKKYCRAYEKDNYGVYRFQINIAMIDYNDLEYMPNEIQQAKKLWEDKNINQPWVTVRNGFALLAHLEYREHDYPYLAHIFTDFLSYEDNKTYYDDYLKEDNVKMVHNKIPIDKENNEPLYGFDVIKAYHEETKKNVPKNVSVATNPFDATALTFDKNSQIQANIVEQSKTNIENGAGINGSIFNTEKTTAQILEKSMQKDANNMQRFLPEFENIFNWLFRGKGCKISFVDSNNYNKSVKISNYGQGLNNGGSRLQYIAYTGLEPYEFLQLSEVEKNIDVDSLMPPKAMSAQLSSSEADSPGAPPLDDNEISDEGERTREKS